jgi:hypothetical protein
MNQITIVYMANSILGRHIGKVRVDSYTNVPTLVLGKNKYYGFKVGRVPRKMNNVSSKVGYTWFSYKGYIFIESSAVSRFDLNMALDKVH